MRRPIVCLLTIALLVLGSIPHGTLRATPARQAPAGPAVVSSAEDAARARLSPELAALAASGATTNVIVRVLVAPGADLGAVAERWRAAATLADQGVAAAVVRADRLVKLASLPGVLRVLPRGDRPSPDGFERPRREQPRAAPGPRPELWYARQSLGVAQANANGYDGSGVIVGVEDSGVDFGHPDLHGTFARDPKPSSPYYGFPLMYDDESAISYVLSGGDPEDTNYADSSRTFRTTVAAGTNGSATIAVPVFTYPNFESTTISRTIQFNNTSKSGVFHYGGHPDSLLWRLEEIGGQQYVVPALFLVADEATAGTYDTVYVDLGKIDDEGFLAATYDFRGVRPARLGPGRDPTVIKDLNRDGLADLSGGLIYFIADGTNQIPILGWLWDLDGAMDPANAIEPPAAGSLVAFFGDYNGGSHGTGVASQIVGQGVINSRYGQGVNTPPFSQITDGDSVVGGVVRGLAPGARIFGLRDLGLPNQWLAATIGYDGVPNSGDDAQVINNSWGYMGQATSLELLNTSATTLNMIPPRPGLGLPNQVIAPRTLFVVSGGNGGQGNTTTGVGPESGSVLAVGAGTQYGTDDITSIIGGVEQITQGDPSSFTSRGPDLYGRVAVGVTAVGSSAAGAVPLLLTANPAGEYDGNAAWEQFGGTSQSGPQASAVAALVFQAFKARTGQFPGWNVARDLMLAGARDTGQDPVVQGAGLVDAQYATALAGGLYGASVAGAEWQVGDYRGTSYLQFPNVVRPGQTYTRTYTFTNPSPHPVTLNLAAEQLVATGSRAFTVTTRLADESPYSFRRPDYLIGPDQLAIPAGTDMLRVQLAQPFSSFCREDPRSPHTGCGNRGSNAWYLRALAWTDRDGDGTLWTDTNGNGAVNNGELDQPATPPLATEPDPGTSLELNALAEGALSGNTQDLRVGRPLERAGDGLYLGLIHRVRPANNAVPTDTLRLKATFYEHRPWSLITLSQTSLTLAAGASASVVATAAIPPSAAYGFYEGAIRVSSSSGNSNAGVRVLHAAAGVGNVDVYIDGARVLSDVPFNNLLATSYRDIAPGIHRFEVRAAGSAADSPGLIDERLLLAAGTEYTIAAVAKTEGATLQPIVDGNFAPPAGQARLRVGHLSPNAGPVDIYVDDQLVLRSVEYREVTVPRQLAAGQHTIAVRPSGSSSSAPPVLGPVPLTITGNTTIYALGLAGGSPALTARLDVAPAASHFPDHTTALPVAVNVAATSNLRSVLQFGGTPAGNTPFDIGRVFGLYDWRGNGAGNQGDWRNFYLDVRGDPAPGTRLVMNTTWANTPSDIDINLFAPRARTTVGLGLFPAATAIFGPYDLALSARSRSTLHDSDGNSETPGSAYSFQTTSGAASEWLAAPAQPGLHMIGLQNVLNAGKSPDGEPYTLRVGAARLLPQAVNSYSNQRQNTATVQFTSSLPMARLVAQAYGLRADQLVRDTVGQAPGNLGDPNGNKIYPITVERSGLLDISLEPVTNIPGYDLDIYLQRKEGNSFVTVDQSAGATASERITVRLPEAGEYRVIVNGYVSPPNSRYELRIRNLEGSDITVSGLPPGAVAANQPVTLTLTYPAAFSDVRHGVVFFGPPDAPTLFEIPVTANRPLFLPFVRR